MPDRPLECRICRARLLPGSSFCAVCGARVDEMPAEELRGITYLLSELARWETAGIIGSEQATALRQRYERRRENLRARIEPDGKEAKPFEPSSGDVSAPQPDAQPPAEATPHTGAKETDAAPRAGVTEAAAPDYAVAAAFSQFLSRSLPPRARVPPIQRPRRTLVETLSDPHIIRLLSFTGAAMLVVGIVIWLKDILYLKLQEPVVQAALLASGTLAVTATGWYIILRTRQRLTGRALTLIGSVLVPVNFWFLVRSGLIANNGRAWVVCAFCALLYAHTAALLRERLYVYLACLASVATLWALVFRTTRDAFGLYALTLMCASLVFLHLSRLFPLDRETHEEQDESSPNEEEEQTSVDDMPSWSRVSYELWGPPLVRAALVGAGAAVSLYLPLRLWPSPSLYDGIFRLRANEYDPSIAMLLFAAAAYIAWFTGRYIYTDRRVSFYTLSALALFWTELLTLDGFRLTGAIHLLMLAATTLAFAIAARLLRDDEASRALHLAGVLLSLVLALAAFGYLLATSVYTVTQGAALACLGLSFALLSTPRFCKRFAQVILAHASAIFASLAFLITLISASLQSETLFVAACAVWPFALYTCAQFAGRRPQSEAQLTAPFVRIADAEFILLFLWASALALLLHNSVEGTLQLSRPSMFCALTAAVLYGALRSVRERSAFGAALSSLAALVMAAAVLDALKTAGLWPASWPVAAGLICAAFLMRKAALGFLEDQREQAFVDARSLAVVVGFVMDSAVMVCALLWFVTAMYHLDDGGWGAASVLVLALLYWIERAARSRLSRPASIAVTHAVAFFITLLIALRIETQWFAVGLVLILFPIFFALGGYARARDAEWLAVPANVAAAVTLMLAFAIALLHAGPHLQAGDPRLLAPCISVGAIALVSFCASLLSVEGMRVRYFRTGLSATVVAFALACLRAGYDPVSDIEIYTSPVAVLLLVIAYLSARRAWAAYDHDTSLLLWLGSLLLAVPLLLHALYFRLLLDVPAPGRDIGTLCASLALILFGIIGRFRAPVLAGLFALTLELAALTLTSVDWLQVPLKYYLITVGGLIVLVVWAFEYRHEQILLARQRFNERREYARERFGEWR